MLGWHGAVQGGAGWLELGWCWLAWAWLVLAGLGFAGAGWLAEQVIGFDYTLVCLGIFCGNPPKTYDKKHPNMGPRSSIS